MLDYVLSLSSLRVVVIASTNRPFDLDEAVLRRLPRRIMVDLPDLHSRKEILSVSLANNRVSPDVNLTKLAEKLEGYTGSDIKEICREAVVRVAHERASLLEGKLPLPASSSSSFPSTTTSPSSNSNSVDEEDDNANENLFDMNLPLRPVSLSDFEAAMKKLKSSIAETGKELQKVIEWNEKYGEMKRKKKSNLSNAFSMYM
jgi:SpoVK/Ycf46/Vps4 family AAA+-type ATPase